MIHIIKCLQDHQHNELKKYRSLFRKQRATREIVTGASVSVSQRHNGLIMSPELWQNLCSFRWLKFGLSLFKSLIPMGLYTSKIQFSSVLKQIKSNFLNLKADGRFLNLASNFPHSLIQKGKKVLLKLFALL